VGCGTGALSQAIIEYCDPADLIGVEPAESFRKRARAVISDPRAHFEAGDAAALPLNDGSCDITVSGLVLNFVPDRMSRLRPGHHAGFDRLLRRPLVSDSAR